MKFLGQHFLRNPAAIQKIIAAIDLKPNETIVEIGSGRGALTIPLAAACVQVGAKLIAIEKDPKLAKGLGATTEVVEGDALTILSSDMLTTKLHAQSFKFVGNIPYYITGHLLRTVSELKEKPTRCVFMLQKEVAERATAVPPKMNRLAASIRFWAEPKIIARLGKDDFSPPPKVDSAVMLLETKQPQPKNAERFYSAVRILFAQPRKTILNNLSSLRTKSDIAEGLTKLGINSGLRPQNLTIMDIEVIAKSFFNATDICG